MSNCPHSVILSKDGLMTCKNCGVSINSSRQGWGSNMGDEGLKRVSEVLKKLDESLEKFLT